MSVQSALQFIQKAETDPAIKKEIRELKENSTIEEIQRIGKKAGFEFTVEALQEAFSKDWVMRRLFHLRPETSDDSIK